MKRNGLALFSLLAIFLMLGGSAFAQDNSVYFTTYFSKANTAAVPDQTLRAINDGTNGFLWAAIYVFDDSEELQECCSCDITPDGLLSERVNEDLTSRPITGIKPTRGVIKVVSSSVFGAAAPPGSSVVVPTPGIRAWGTHVQKSGARYDVTETLFADSNLAASELVLLQELCYFDAKLSGKTCFCTAEDNDF